jgi:hypothetical protein
MRSCVRSCSGGRAVVISVVALLALGPSAVGGGGFAGAADYESLMRDAVSKRRAGDDIAALKLFQQAYELNKTPKALAQMGLAEQALGRWGAADKHLRQALATGGSDPWINKNRAAIGTSLDTIVGHVGQLDVIGQPEGADVRVDGESVGQLPLGHPIVVTAGGVAVEVSARGYLPILRSTTVSVGKLTRELFNLQPVAPVADQSAHRDPTSTTEPTASVVPPSGAAPAGGGSGGPPPDHTGDSAPAASSSRLPWVLTAAGLSAASLAFGVIEHVAWQNKVSSFASMSTCGTTFPSKGGPGCQSLYDDGQSAKLRAFVGYGLGAAFAATAIILYVTAPSHGAAPARVACAPSVGTTGVGCAFRF